MTIIPRDKSRRVVQAKELLPGTYYGFANTPKPAPIILLVDYLYNTRQQKCYLVCSDGTGDDNKFWPASQDMEIVNPRPCTISRIEVEIE